MTLMTKRKRAGFGTVAAVALAMMGSVVVAAPAQAVCSGAYLSVNTAAQASAKVSSNCTNGSTIRARKNWYYTDSSNSTVGASYGPWIGSTSLTSTTYLPSGRYHKSNLIESS